MATFKHVMDTSTREEMSALCQRYKGVYHFATTLEKLAKGIADNSIPVPEGYDRSSQVGLKREVMRRLPERWLAVLSLQETMDKRSLCPRVAPHLMAGRFPFFDWVQF